MLYREIIDVYYENHREQKNTERGKMWSFVMLQQAVHIFTAAV
jgi:hypothetical protein